MYIAQSGALYSFSAGRFHQLTPEDGWMQPALYPDGSALVAVKRSLMFSDVYALTLYGKVGGRFTFNEAAPRDKWDTGANAWSFYPRLSPDQRTLYMSYDGPKRAGNGYYDVDLAVWAQPVGGTTRQAKLWTNSNSYTGGDLQPLPLPSGGLIYTKYTYDPNQNRVGQLWYTNRAGSPGKPLTSTGAGCSEPALSPDGHNIAMICTYQKQISYLTIASWNGSSLGPLQTVISDQLVAQPIWAPDGSGIAYLAPGGPAAPFQLWWLPKNAYAPPAPSPVPTPTPTPGGPHNGPLPTPDPSPVPTPPVIKPIQVTTNLGFDATSPLAWLA
jgi:Tol biopolymer transport system component